ncbi:hypothetical protein BDZ45DRAFT_811538 [Acephala macrosclerotiorum]|nr:hypothetical protein BDZ45DRAFT_811538 [Acephala macrosclerotiorum]
MNVQERDNIFPLLYEHNSPEMDTHTPSQPKGPRTPSIISENWPNENKPKSTRFEPLKKRKRAILGALIHVPSVAISLGVLSLTFLQVFWEAPSERTNAVLNSLQFAAQLHTSLIALSLSAMLLFCVQRCLRSEKGAPLGFLSSNFQLHSLGYLFSKEFRSLSWRYIGIFLLPFALAMLAGPSSAITMLPRLQFWSLNNFWVGKGHMDFHVYIAANETTLWPSTLTSANFPAQCSGANASLLDECPSSGIRSWLQHDDLFIIYGDAPQTINKSLEETTAMGGPSGNFLRYMVGQTSSVNVYDQSVYLTSTLSKFLAKALVSYGNVLQAVGIGSSVFGYNDEGGTIQDTEANTLLARYDLSFNSGGKTIATRKPVVEVECAGYAPENTSLALLHSEMAWPPWTSDPIASAEWDVQTSEYSSLAQDLNSTIVNSSFVDVSQFGSVAPSLAAVFATAQITSEGGRTNRSWYACTIDARWMPTTTFWDSSSGTAAVFDSNPNPNAAIEVDAELSGLHPYALDMVSIDTSFADLLAVPWADSLIDPTPTNRTILDTIGQKCFDANTRLNSTSGLRLSSYDKMTMLICLNVGLSIYITDAMSRVQDSLPIYFVAEGNIPTQSSTYCPNDIFYIQDLFASDTGSTCNEVPGETNGYGQIQGVTKQDLQDTTRFTEMRFDASRWGYGYGFEGSTLIYVGVVVLLLHVAVCLIFVAWSVGVGEGVRKAGWETIGELVVMGMRSGAAMGKGGVLDGEKRRWKERYVVEEVNSEGESSGRDGSEQTVLRRVGDREKDGGLTEDGIVMKNMSYAPVDPFSHVHE